MRRAVEVRIDRRWIGVTWMRVASVCVGLPHFDGCVTHRLTGNVQDAPHDVEDLPGGAAGATGYSRQIDRLRQFLEWIEGPKDLARCARQPRCFGGSTDRTDRRSAGEHCGHFEDVPATEVADRVDCHFCLHAGPGLAIESC